MHPIIPFFLYFTSIENFFMYFELDDYMGRFVSDIEGGRTENIRKGVFSYGFWKALLGYMMWYIFAVTGFYYLILKRGGSVFDGALYGAVLCVVSDFTLHSMFSGANNSHLGIILYDVVVVGAFVFGFSTLIWKNYKSFVSDYWFVFFLTFVISMVLCFKKTYEIEMSPYIPPEKLKLQEAQQKAHQ